MIYLITQLSGFLLVTAFAAGVGGWALAAINARPREQALMRDRDRLVRDLAQLAAGEGPPPMGDEGALETLRGRFEVKAARVAELEHALNETRERADSAVVRIAELERELAHQNAPPQRAVEVEATPVSPPAPTADAPDEDATLQAWRLRYFEQRVRYLENGGRPQAPKTNGTPMEWRARVAEARATHLEQEVRDAERTPRAVAAPIEAAAEPAETSAFAADVETDALLRWRMLYLERRVAHLQEQGGETPAPGEPASQSFAAPSEAGPDPDRWKWRARYLEARVRHLESRLTAPLPSAQPVRAVAVMSPDEEAAPPPAPQPSVPTERPPSLAAARDGAPDDFRLIEGVTAMLQNTLYSLGVFHFDQIAAWTPAHAAWVDNYLRLRGRIGEEEWVEQADALAREGPAAARREETEPA